MKKINKPRVKHKMQTFTFEGEDHTLGVLLREKLLENKNVLFVAYKIEHPLTRTIKLCIQTNEDSDPHKELKVAAQSALDDILLFSKQLSHGDNSSQRSMPKNTAQKKSVPT